MVWGDGFEIETLINCRFAAAGAVIREVPSVELERIHGTSNLQAIPDGLRVLRTVRRERVRASRLKRRRADSGVDRRVRVLRTSDRTPTSSAVAS
jgi:hypothetical protein